MIINEHNKYMSAVKELNKNFVILKLRNGGYLKF